MSHPDCFDNSCYEDNCCNFYGQCPSNYPYSTNSNETNCFYFYNNDNFNFNAPDSTAIIGGAAGGGVALFLIILIIVICCVKKKRSDSAKRQIDLMNDPGSYYAEPKNLNYNQIEVENLNKNTISSFKEDTTFMMNPKLGEKKRGYENPYPQQYGNERPT